MMEEHIMERYMPAKEVTRLMRATYEEVVAKYAVQGRQCIATAIIFRLSACESQTIETSSLYNPTVNNETLYGLDSRIRGLLWDGRVPVALLFAVDTEPVEVVVKYCREYQGWRCGYIDYDLDRFLRDTIWDMNAIEYTYDEEKEIPECDTYRVRARDGDNG